jgi:hypothetical protein
LATIDDSNTTLICAEDLTENYYDLEQADKIPKWGGAVTLPSKSLFHPI